jgi:hypothetical protein
LPISDIDILAHFYVAEDTWSRYQSDSSDFLYRVRLSLNNSSTVKAIGARGQAVRFFYADGFWVDVAAVVKYTSGGYGIPNGAGGWQTTDPLAHEKFIDKRNSDLSGNLKPLIKLLRRWNGAHSSRFNSFHMEVVAAHSFGKLGTNLRAGCRGFFEWSQTRLSVQDPAGYGAMPRSLS